jgi:hypothetical protein
MQLGLSIEFSPGDAALCAHGAAPGVNMDAFHRAQVDHDTAIDGRAARDVMTAAANGYFEPEPLRNVDGINDIRHTAASGN